MGVDPGLAATGYAVVEQGEGGRLELCSCAVLRTPARLPLSERLQMIYSALGACIEDYRPRAAVFEELFVARDYKMALRLGQAMGAAKLAAAQAGLPVFGYSVSQVKQAVVGYGRAQKKQVQAMVARLLTLPAVPSSEHEADALAVAVCHLHSAALQGRLEGCRR